MNRQKIIPFVFSVFLLSACSFFPTQKSSNTSDNSVIVDVTQQEEQVKPLSCEMLMDAKMRDACKEEVNQAIAQTLETEILHTFDIVRCDQLVGYDAEGCKSRIISYGVTMPVTLADYDAMREAIRPVRPASAEGAPESAGDAWDITRCDSVAAPLKAYCRKQINQQIQENLLFNIIASKDSSRCAELTVQEFKVQCQQEFGTYVEPEQVNPNDAAADAPSNLPVDDPVMDAPSSASADAVPAGTVFPFQKVNPE